jgi:hypothetical protein
VQEELVGLVRIGVENCVQNESRIRAKAKVVAQESLQGGIEEE